MIYASLITRMAQAIVIRSNQRDSIGRDLPHILFIVRDERATSHLMQSHIWDIRRRTQELSHAYIMLSLNIMAGLLEDGRKIAHLHT